MLDFNEVGRRITERNTNRAISHEYIISPLVGQLLDPEYVGENGVMLAPHECVNVGATILRQAQLLDAADEAMQDMVECAADDGTTMSRRVGWLVIGAVLWAVFITGVLIGRLL